MAEVYVNPDREAHWYYPDGTPCHKLKAKGETVDGTGMRNVDVRDALELGLYPSVTNALGVVYKPGLELWKQNQLVLAALDYSASRSSDTYVSAPREQQAAWIIARANEPSDRGKDMGTRMHKAIDLWLKRKFTELTHIDEDIADFLDGFVMWFNSSGIEATKSEVAKASEFYGFGGTFDLFGNIPHAEGEVPVDWKTQDFDCVCDDRRRCRKKHPRHYPEWGCQLAAYDVLETMALSDGAASVAISNVVPGLIDLHFYDEDENRGNWLSFLTALRLWYSKLGKGWRLPRPEFMVREEEMLS